MLRVEPFQKQQEEAVITLITAIQQNEYGLAITAADQPDLRLIDASYRANGGEFWVALDEQRQVVGTIGVVFLANQQAVIKKLFVVKTARQQKVGQTLLAKLLDYCQKQTIQAVWLGTTAQFKAAHAFYAKQGFKQVETRSLPHDFPRMAVDSLFFRYALPNA